MARRLTVEQTSYPLPIRIANAALTILGRLGVYAPDVSRDGMIAAAKRQTGLDDVWPVPDAWEGMSKVIDNVDALGFTPFSRQIMRETFMKGLKNRARYVDHVRRHPEILDIPVKRPIFVLGFPRTGTTALQNLLALHPERRGLEFWELYTPTPVHPDPVVDERRRRRIATNSLRVGYAVAPEMGAIHEIRTDTLEEDWYLFWNTFRVLNWDIMTGFEDYGRWLMDLDMTGTYREFRAFLQVMLHRQGAEHLVLKCPEHLWFVDALLEVFPDACIIWTHRDPVASVASYCSLMSLSRRMIYGKFEPKVMGPYITERFHQGVTRAMAARDRWGRPENFYDVDFQTLVRDPVGVMRDICSHFDLAWREDEEPAQILAWQDSDREDKRGTHVYSAEAFGIDPADVHARYADYIERFRIPVKREGR